MVRWTKFQRNPERVWVNWNPDEWAIPVHFLILGGLFLLAFTVPWFGEALFSGPHRRGWAFGLLESVGLGVAVAIGYAVYLFRRRKREQLARTLQPQDWVCARCLHAERE